MIMRLGYLLRDFCLRLSVHPVHFLRPLPSLVNCQNKLCQCQSEVFLIHLYCIFLLFFYDKSIFTFFTTYNYKNVFNDMELHYYIIIILNYDYECKNWGNEKIIINGSEHLWQLVILFYLLKCKVLIGQICRYQKLLIWFAHDLPVCELNVV